jgi:murein L,D-transpeptidase YafK
MRPKYPNIFVRLSGQNGNAFMIVGVCIKAARQAGLPKSEIDAFVKEATNASYDDLLQTVMRWFNCE